jgi:MFS family permease
MVFSALTLYLAFPKSTRACKALNLVDSLGSDYQFLKEQNILVLISCRIIWGMTQLLFTPYFSLFILAQPGGSPEILGIVASVKVISFIIITPIAGLLTDSRGRVTMITLGTVLHAITYLFYVFANDVTMIILGSFAEGLSLIHLPALRAITHESLKPRTKGLGLSATTGLESLPRVIAPFLGGVLTEWIGIDAGMRIGFTLGFFVGLLVAFIRYRFLQETLQTPLTESIKITKIWNVLQTSYSNMLYLLREYISLRGLVVVAALNAFFAALTAQFWIVYAQNTIGASTTEWGVIEMIVAPYTILVLLFSGKLVDRYGRKRIILSCLALAPGIILVFLFSSNFLTLLAFRLGLATLNSFALPATTAIISDIVPSHSRGRAFAAIGMIPITISLDSSASGFYMFLPSITGSVASGFIYSFNPQLPWVLLTIGYIAQFGLSWLLIKEPHRTYE